MSEGTKLSSGEKTTDAVIADRRSSLHGVLLIPDGTNDLTLVIYDNASAASGTILFKAIVKGSDTSFQWLSPEGGIRAVNGMYADITTSGSASYIVHYT